MEVKEGMDQESAIAIEAMGEWDFERAVRLVAMDEFEGRRARETGDYGTVFCL